ncbi:MAG: DUF3179 domain-containing protein [bacterium]
MLLRKVFFSVILFSVFVFVSCSSSSSDITGGSNNNNNVAWNIPASEVVSGGVGKDGIPSLFNPKTISANQASFLRDQDLVVGIVVDGQARAYPHTILDWHEVVNEDFGNDHLLTVSYCPLTGTAIVFKGNNAGRKLTFGVSGLLFNNNLIMFDRQTNSHWPQMRLQSDEGTLRNAKQIVLNSIETSWGSWKKLFPNTVILSTDTGFNRPYGRPGSAYPGYNVLNSRPLFPISFTDSRLPNKQRVHGVIYGEDADSFTTKVYPIRLSQSTRLIHDVVSANPLLIIDSGENNFVVSYLREVDGTTLTFDLSGSLPDLPFTFKDNETGSTWNVLGEAIAGPLAGTQLQRPVSYNAFWFAWGVFFRNAEIYNN